MTLPFAVWATAGAVPGAAPRPLATRRVTPSTVDSHSALSPRSVNTTAGRCDGGAGTQEMLYGLGPSAGWVLGPLSENTAAMPGPPPGSWHGPQDVTTCGTMLPSQASCGPASSSYAPGWE